MTRFNIVNVIVTNWKKFARFFPYSNILRRFLRLIAIAVNDVFIAQKSEIIISRNCKCYARMIATEVYNWSIYYHIFMCNFIRLTWLHTQQWSKTRIHVISVGIFFSSFEKFPELIMFYDHWLFVPSLQAFILLASIGIQMKKKKRAEKKRS